jgi:hypothetical protein
MESPPPVIEYASADAGLVQPNARRAVTLGAIATLFAVGPACSWFLYRYCDVGPIGLIGALIASNFANVIGLILGGIGWASTRHYRPSRGYRWCVCANVLNWFGIGFFYVSLLLLTGLWTRWIGPSVQTSPPPIRTGAGAPAPTFSPGVVKK